MRYSVANHPPSRNERYVICQVCGFKFHRKDTTKVIDRYNKHYGLIVCRADNDKTNAQDRPFKVSETILTDPGYVSPRQDPVFLENPNDDRLPGKPSNGQGLLNSLTDTLDLYWDGPGDNGSSAIIGYAIKRSAPQLGIYILIATTDTSATYYSDTTADPTAEYSYKIAAINSFGTGPYSEDFYWPTDINVVHDVDYLCISQSPYPVLETGSGILLRTNYINRGVF